LTCSSTRASHETRGAIIRHQGVHDELDHDPVADLDSLFGELLAQVELTGPQLLLVPIVGAELEHGQAAGLAGLGSTLDDHTGGAVADSVEAELVPGELCPEVWVFYSGHG
jgi:hypothetical protein